MDINLGGKVNNLLKGASVAGLLAVVAFVVLSIVAVSASNASPGALKLVGISWTAFAAMTLAAPLGARTPAHGHPRVLVWGYGLASGAMITSASVFLLPQALGLHPQFGGVGVAAGVLTGFAAHTVGHRLAHDVEFDHTVLELSAHALSAGTIIGVIYGNMPNLGVLLGLAIVSHKAPAGYAAARRLVDADKPVSILLVPASGVGIAAILAALVRVPSNSVVSAVVFGFATGVFLHVAMDFLPSCELGSEIYEVASVSPDAHTLLDRLRLHAVASTALGGIAVALAWLVVS